MSVKVSVALFTRGRQHTVACRNGAAGPAALARTCSGAAAVMGPVRSQGMDRTQRVAGRHDPLETGEVR